MGDLNKLNAQYREMEAKLKVSKETHETLVKEKEDLTLEQTRLNQKWEALVADNRNLKSSLLDAERYKEEYREESEIVAMLKKKYKECVVSVVTISEDLKQAR